MITKVSIKEELPDQVENQVIKKNTLKACTPKVAV